MAHRYDDITAEQLWRQGHLKWQQPGVFGAWIAEMDFPLAPPIAAALHQGADDALTGYLPSRLGERLAQACAGLQRERYGWPISPEQVHPITDGLSAFEVAIEHFSRPASPIIVPTPNYMPFFVRPGLLGRAVFRVPMAPDGGRYRFDLDAISAAFARGAHMLVLTNPHNPIGQVARREELVALSEVVAAHGGRVFADEIHGPLVYPGSQHVPYASVSDTAASHCLTLTSAAKAWNIPGLKCAQVILTAPGDAESWRAAELSERHAPSTLGALANQVAYDEGGPWLDDTLAYLDSNRRVLVESFAELLPALHVPTVEGTYLTLLDFSPLSLPMPAATFLKDRAHVWVTPGPACGTDSDQVVRFNFAMPAPVLRACIEAIAAACR